MCATRKPSSARGLLESVSAGTLSNCVQTLEILLATLLFWDTSFGDPLSVQKNAGKDLSFTERSEMPLTVSADGLSPLSLIESNDERLVFGHVLFTPYALQNIMESLQCFGARSFEDLSWDTVFS